MSLKIFVLWFFLKILFFSSSSSCWPVTETKITAAGAVIGTGNTRDDIESIERDSMTREDDGGVGKNEVVDVNKPPTEYTETPTVKVSTAKRTRATEEESSINLSKKNIEDYHDWPLMADQPMNDDGFKTISVAPLDDDDNLKLKKNFGLSSSTIDPITKIRMAQGDDAVTSLLEYDSDKNQRLAEIRSMVPFMTGRANITETNDENNSSTNSFELLSNLPPIEKFVAFPPKCNIPKIAKDNWKDENLLYLFFNVTYGINATLASAIIKLDRISSENDNLNVNNNNNNNSGEEIGEKERLLRVSIYWFSKQGKKQKIKKRLCDSKVINEKQSSVELNVKPALNSWLDSQNLGFAVKVENQEEIVLKASNFFKGIDCKSIPVQPFPQINHLLNDSSNAFHTKTLEDYLALMGYSPIISICTVESITGAPLTEKYLSCQLHKSLLNQTENESNHRKMQNLIGINPTNHHRIRHQKHFEGDIRKLMVNETIYLVKDHQFDLYKRVKTR